MGRLIDADELIDEIKSKMPTGASRGVFLAFIDEQSTAYDVEKVVAELEQLEDRDTREVYLTKHIVLDEAIEIVRNGGAT